MKLATTLLLLSGALLPCSVALACTPAPRIMRWLGPKANGLCLSHITPITLTGGESAYLASASNSRSDASGKAWMGYVLARPGLEKAIAIQGKASVGKLGGGYDKIKIIYQSSRGTVLLLGSSSGGQGVFDDTRSIVVFDGWKPEFLYTAKMHSNLGACGPGIGACVGNTVFLNPLEMGTGPHAIAVVETNVAYSGSDWVHLDYKVASRLLTFPLK